MIEPHKQNSGEDLHCSLDWTLQKGFHGASSLSMINGHVFFQDLIGLPKRSLSVQLRVLILPRHSGKKKNISELFSSLTHPLYSLSMWCSWLIPSLKSLLSILHCHCLSPSSLLSVTPSFLTGLPPHLISPGQFILYITATNKVLVSPWSPNSLGLHSKPSPIYPPLTKLNSH